MTNLVSIIIPCYNSKLFLKKCLDSVIVQTYHNIEIICVNDGSTDDTEEILKEYQTKDNRINIVSQENQGLSAARNTGINASRGKYITFVDHDDWIDDEMIEILVSCICNRVMSCCSYKRVWLKNEKIRNLNISFDINPIEVQRRIVGLVGFEMKDPSQADSLVTAWGKLYLTEILKSKKIEFINAKDIGTEDAYFNILYLNEFTSKDSVYIHNAPLYNYRKYNQSLSNSYNLNLFSKWLNLYDKIELIIKNKDAEFKKALSNRICFSIIGLGLNEIYGGANFSIFKKKIKEILGHPTYRQAFKSLDYNYLTLQWKIFFYLADKKQTTLLFLFFKFIKYKVAA